MKKMLKNLRSKGNKLGFTLLEMVLVLFIVAALLLLIIPNMTQQTENVEAKTDSALIQTVETQMEVYAMQENKSKPSVEELASQNYITEDQAEKYNQIKGSN